MRGRAMMLCYLAVGCLLGNAAPAFGRAGAPVSGESAAGQTWKKFRTAQPFQIQVVALTQESGSQKRTLIVSEPSPAITAERLLSVLGKHAIACETREWTVMAGGTVRDLVCSVQNTDRDGWPAVLAQIQLAAFGSTDGMSVVALPVPPRIMIAHNLDVRFGARDLYNWLIASDQPFRSNAIAPIVKMNEILKRGVRGVFSSQDRALVIWAFDRRRPIDGAGADIRRFSMASDLILGGVANENVVILVGRGRLEPLAHLPPLRSETVLLLAGSPEQELAQSYERTDIIAGSGTDGIDRAPILLSPQLVDTEFGTLLNVADQLLKGWSRAGTIKYNQFAYPPPKTYPFGKVPARLVHPGRDTFLYNWNTDGAAYRQKIAGLDIIVPQRSGALSVIYGDPRDRPRDLEDVAYDYFARSGDTTLARVVQYTLVYQIFRQFKVTAEAPPISPRYQQFSQNIDAVTRRQFKYLLDEISDSELERALRQLWRQKALKENASRSQTSEGKIDEATIERIIAEVMSTARALRNVPKSRVTEIANALADVAAFHRQRSKSTSDDQRRVQRTFEMLSRQYPEIEMMRLLRPFTGTLTQSGLIQIAMEKTGGWKTLGGIRDSGRLANHTAYVVESRGIGQLSGATGGHNLDAAVTKYSSDASVPKGTVALTRDSDGGWLVRHNPADDNRLATITREVGTRRTLDANQIQAELAKILQTLPPQAPVKMAALRQVTGHASEFKPTRLTEAGNKAQALSHSQQKVLGELAAADRDAIVMEQLGDGQFVLSRTGSTEALQLPDLVAATDALANGLIANAGGRGPVSVLVNGVPPEKAEAMLSFVQASLRRRSKDSVDHVLTGRGDFAAQTERARFVNAKIAHNGLEIDRSGVKVSKVTTGIYEGFTRVEVPVLIKAAQPWHVRLVIYCKSISNAALQAFLTRLSTVLAAIKGPLSIADANILIRQQLKQDLHDLNIDALMMEIDSDPTHKVHDVLIGELSERRRDAA